MASNKKTEPAEKDTDEIYQIVSTVMQDFRVRLEMRQMSRPMDFFPLK